MRYLGWFGFRSPGAISIRSATMKHTNVTSPAAPATSALPRTGAEPASFADPHMAPQSQAGVETNASLMISSISLGGALGCDVLRRNQGGVVAPRRALMIGDFSDLLVGELTGKSGHLCFVSHAAYGFSFEPVQKGADMFGWVGGSNYGVAGKRRECAGDSLALGAVTHRAGIAIEFRSFRGVEGRRRSCCGFFAWRCGGLLSFAQYGVRMNLCD